MRRCKLLRVTMMGAALLFASLTAKAQHKDDIVIADFEGKDYGGWEVKGDAFGPGPAQGAIAGQMAVSGYLGHGLVNSFFNGDKSTGTLTSPEFIIQRKYINFLIGGGNHPDETGMRLLIEGKEARKITGIDSERLTWATWDVHALIGRTARLEIFDHATGGWGHINVDQIVQSDEREAEEVRTEPLFQESYRPQFHFSAQKNWLNDPNGLVYYKGEYHLFFQHNPMSTSWGNMTWGHAVSRDLVHWQQLPHALLPDRLGTMFSGSAVVDAKNTTGFGVGSEAPIVAMYTAAGDTSPESKGQPFTQCIAFSTDRGRTFTKYDQNPVLKHIIGGNRDPKLVWHSPTHQWTLALYLDGEDYGLFTSPNLKEWKQIQTIHMPGSSECPDFFELPIKGERNESRWVFTGANGRYLVGSFDGKHFAPEAPPQPADYGANYYAVQTYSDIPASDGRRIQIAWMNGGNYPNMPFNQQMSFPCELTLRRIDGKLHLYRWPVKEIKNIAREAQHWSAIEVKPGENPLNALSGDLWDIQAEIEPGEATAFGFAIRGEMARYDVKSGEVSCLGRTAPLRAEHGRIRLRLLVDRSSIELFGNDGAVSMTSCFVPKLQNHSLDLFAEGGPIRITALTVTPLASAWPAHPVLVP